jgi:hypothetical protein
VCEDALSVDVFTAQCAGQKVAPNILVVKVIGEEQQHIRGADVDARIHETVACNVAD